ncbi:hypothetical protein PoB_004256500 [Plakobranchus ocellatus]|uniref:Uncharacterized protein n=1 Tax=Plakobranchus ocellatus TaxID=259542 RepID=A0AAV4B656_9GAST|nr:hypothetical protein PoB_004256500 [Plakobranchus ocellatus]
MLSEPLTSTDEPRSRVLIVLGIRHSEVVCNCFARRLYFHHRILKDMATHLVLGGHRGAMRIDLAWTGIRTSEPHILANNPSPTR